MWGVGHKEALDLFAITGPRGAGGGGGGGGWGVEHDGFGHDSGDGGRHGRGRGGGGGGGGGGGDNRDRKKSDARTPQWAISRVASQTYKSHRYTNDLPVLK